MSQRGGGSGGGGGRNRPSPSSSDFPSLSQTGGGRGRGGGGGGGRGGSGGGGRGTSYSTAPSYAMPSAPIRSVTEIGSSSSAVASLSRDVEQSLTLQEPVSSTPAMDLAPASAEPPATSKAVRFPVRPGPGSAGVRCVVKANHFLVNLGDKDLHHYDVSITPEVTSRGVNRAILSQLVEMHRKSHLGNRMPAYDGRKSLYTAGALPFNSKEFSIKLAEKDGKPTTRKEREFKVVIKFASRPDLHNLQQFLIGKLKDAPHEAIQVLDVVLRESPSNKYIVVGRSFFSPNFGNRGGIGDGLECWRGYYQSLRPTQMGVSLNMDVSATSFYEPINLVQFVINSLNLRDASRPLSDIDRVKIKKVLRGVRIELTHRKGKMRHKISGITTQATRQLTFPVDEMGTTKSVVQYFQEKYGVVLKYAHWPCLQAGSDARPVYLPMEVCQIVEGQKYSKKLNEKQVTGMLRATCKRPSEREAIIAQMVKHNNYTGDEYAKEFGIQVSEKLTTISGARVLPPPVLKYHDTGRDKKVQPYVGQWNMINTKMVNGGRVEHFACLNLSQKLNREIANQFFKDLVGMCTSKGMAFNPQPLLPIREGRADQIDRVLVDLHKDATTKLEKMQTNVKQLQLLIIILPDFSGSYGKIKRICETELGIVSQCCQPRQAAKLNKQYLENVSLKINVKVGGRNTVLEDALSRRLPIVSEKPTIIFGADVTHPQPGEDSSPSIAAVVASMDWPEISKYRCLVSAQPHRQELINDLYKVGHDSKKGTAVHGGMIREHLIAFRRATGHRPCRIIFYRDGVSEGQFAQVLLYEIDAIRKACKSLEEEYLPPITFVVVQKRHHTRLFPDNHGDRRMTDKSGNILPGTVVDSMICHPTEFDFYLCSHAGIQGTSRPTHYHVLFDENKFSADALQILTNNLCYTYARCTRSVSVVPPAYYAHLGAFRARYYIEGDTSESGSVSSGGGGGRNTRERTTVVRPLPQIKDCVKDVMFYC